MLKDSNALLCIQGRMEKRAESQATSAMNEVRRKKSSKNSKNLPKVSTEKRLGNNELNSSRKKDY